MSATGTIRDNIDREAARQAAIRFLSRLKDHMDNPGMNGTPGHKILESMRGLALLCHLCSVATGWWHNLIDGAPRERNKGEMLALIHSEVSEALEGERKDRMDNHLIHRRMVEVELADAVIRIFDYAEGFGLDVTSALIEKLAYNLVRQDHKDENRLAPGGKVI